MRPPINSNWRVSCRGLFWVLWNIKLHIILCSLWKHIFWCCVKSDFILILNTLTINPRNQHWGCKATFIIQSNAVITRSNITYQICYCSHWDITQGELAKDIPYLALTGKLWDVFVRIREKIDRIIASPHCKTASWKQPQAKCTYFAFTTFMSNLISSGFNILMLCTRYQHGPYIVASLNKTACSKCPCRPCRYLAAPMTPDSPNHCYYVLVCAYLKCHRQCYKAKHTEPEKAR